MSHIVFKACWDLSDQIEKLVDPNKNCPDLKVNFSDPTKSLEIVDWWIGLKRTERTDNQDLPVKRYIELGGYLKNGYGIRSIELSGDTHSVIEQLRDPDSVDRLLKSMARKIFWND